MALNLGGIGSGLQQIGGAVSDLFGAQGSTAAAGGYKQASDIARKNIELSKAATSIQLTQTGRQIYKVLGTQRAQIGAAGFSEGGTAMDLLRSSTSEGALEKAIMQEQGQITANTYNEQANQYEGMASAATSTAGAQTAGGAIGLIGGIASIASAFF